MTQNNTLIKCPRCLKEFQIGPPRNDGITIPRYQITVCRSCYDSNWDGWDDEFEKYLIDHLKLNNLPLPQKNANERLPRN